jgi:hypothetical protein
MIVIRNRCTDNIIYRVEAASTKEAVEKLVAEGKSLSRANLYGANLNDADLSGASLSGASLSGASLSGADLRGADLRGASLYGADLSGAILSGASLRGANLSRADLTKQDLTTTYYQVGYFLHSYDWGILPDNLTLELMRRDALICGNDAMQKWADGGDCPFSGYIERDFWFEENRTLWSPGPPMMNDMELFRALCAVKEIKI